LCCISGNRCHTGETLWSQLCSCHKCISSEICSTFH
jgi:hypothetical protein